MCSLIVCSISLYCYVQIKRVYYYYLKKSARNIANKDYIALREPLCKSLNIRVGKKTFFVINLQKFFFFLFKPGILFFMFFFQYLCIFCEITNLCFRISHVFFYTYGFNNGFIL